MSQERWELSRAWLRWRVIRVTDLGVVAGVPTKPFRTVERTFWRYRAAIEYVLSRPATAHIRVTSGVREGRP